MRHDRVFFSLFSQLDRQTRRPMMPAQRGDLPGSLDSRPACPFERFVGRSLESLSARPDILLSFFSRVYTSYCHISRIIFLINSFFYETTFFYKKQHQQKMKKKYDEKVQRKLHFLP
jgi:hypothetical protein